MSAGFVGNLWNGSLKDLIEKVEANEVKLREDTHFLVVGPLRVYGGLTPLTTKQKKHFSLKSDCFSSKIGKKRKNCQIRSKVIFRKKGGVDH